ncbi:MAG: hypothetical protein P1V35_03825 [Planctomycetota bacterium]|nr:hypothetical protein [Planctomycetota bacterium]
MIQRGSFAAWAFSLLSIALLTLSSPLSAGTFQDDEEVDPKLAEAIKDLESAPNDVASLEATARAALAAEEQDQAFWYASLALARLPETTKTKKLRKVIDDLRLAIGSPGLTPEELQDAVSREIFDMAKACEKKKLYANAADLLKLCIGTSMQSRAEERLTKMFSKKKAVAALIESGIDFEIPGGRRVNKKKRAEVNKKNMTWEDPYEIKGKYYIVRTDMGYDYAHAFLDAMEQMNAFYRTVFNYKVRGGTMRSCRIDVYSTREIFDRVELENRGQPIGPNVGGFFVPGENRVATFDSRSQGGTIDDLWSTLFHEASHQFTRAVLPGLLLTWLNEGTASYFEGAFLQPGGSVAKNRIPKTRLRSLYRMLGFKKGKEGDYVQKHKPHPSAPTLEQVITYYRPGSYPGSYYPFGWGLVYFFHNYENENSERIYLPIYKEFMLTYKSGGDHDIKARFVEYFVTKAAVEGVTTFEEFEEHWMVWIRSLHDLHYGGPEQSAQLIARGKHQLENEKLEYALDSFRWALEKDPKNHTARMRYAEAAMLMERWDLAAFHWRKLESATRRIIDQDSPMPTVADKTAGEVRAYALEKLGEVNPRLRDGLVNSVDLFVAKAQEVAGEYVDGDRPLSALYLLESSARLVDGDARLVTAAQDIETESGVTLKRGYRPSVPDDLEGWSARSTFSADDGILEVKYKGGINTAVIEEAPPIPFRWEVVIKVDDQSDFPIAGITFGSTLNDEQMLAWFSDSRRLALLITDPETKALVPEEMTRLKKAEGSKKKSSRSQIHLAIEVREDRVIFFANGQEMFEKEMPAHESRGRVGVFVQGTSAKFTDMRIEY